MYNKNMKYFASTYTDFIKFDKKPNEDFYLASSKYLIFAVADGVTQAHFPSGKYAFPAGAQAASKIFCHALLEFLEKKLSQKKISLQKLIRGSFNLANKRIKELNKREGITQKMDNLIYDYFDTVGVVGFIKNNYLYYGYVGDCSLKIFNKENKLKFETEDKVALARERAKKKYKKWDQFSKNQKTIIMHKEYRNTLLRQGYGSFTGEKGVEKYYKIGREKLENKDLIVFHSDGFSEYFQFLEFIKILRKQDKSGLDDFTFKKAKQNPTKFGTDRTLISIIF